MKSAPSSGIPRPEAMLTPWSAAARPATRALADEVPLN